MAKRKKRTPVDFLNFGRSPVSNAPLNAVEVELDRLMREEIRLAELVEQVRVLYEGGHEDLDPLNDWFATTDTDTSVEDMLALEISRLVLSTGRTNKDLHRARKLLSLMERVESIRATTRNEFQRLAELETVGHFDDHESDTVDDVAYAKHLRQMIRENDFESLRAAVPASVTEDFQSRLLFLVKEPVVDRAGGEDDSQTSTLERIKIMARTRMELMNDYNVHGLNFPSFDQRMDAHWSNLDSETRDAIINEVQRTIIMWHVAEPALRDESKPGAVPALIWGLQLPYTLNKNETLRRSSLYAELNNLRAAWAHILRLDPNILLWTAEVFAPADAYGAALEALRGFATHQDWGGKAGRKHRSGKYFRVGAWQCARCGSTYLPGDSTHDSPLAEQMKASVTIEDEESFENHGRVLKGLPAEARRWNRLMCNNVTSAQPCWRSGGVLVPLPMKATDSPR